MMRLVAVLLVMTPFLIGQEKNVYTVGIAASTGYPESVRGFKQALASAGLGKNVVYIQGKNSGDPEDIRLLALSFLDRKVDLVYSLTTTGTKIIKEVLPNSLPIVFSIVTYPADSGLIDSFEYSGNNLVGTSNYVELPNYTKLLKYILPQAKSLAIFHRKGEPNSKIQAVNVIRLLRREGIKVYDMEPAGLDEVRSMALSMVGKVDVLMTTTDTLMQAGGEKILIELSLQEKLPILSSNKDGIVNGSTFGPVADFFVLGKMSGAMAARILGEGIQPAKLQSRLQDPPTFLVNKNSIRALGIDLNFKAIGNVTFVE